MGPNSDPQGTACENREPIEKGRSVLIHSCEGVGGQKKCLFPACGFQYPRFPVWSRR